MGYKITAENFDSLLKNLSKEYKIYAPKRFPKQGRYSDTDIVRYDRVYSQMRLYMMRNQIMQQRKH